jgi:hypothetical protein
MANSQEIFEQIKGLFEEFEDKPQWHHKGCKIKSS